MLVGQTQEHDVRLFGEILRLLDHVDKHLLDWALIRCNLLLDKDGSLALKRVDCVGTIELLFDVRVVIQSSNFLEEYFQVVFHFLCVL